MKIDIEEKTKKSKKKMIALEMPEELYKQVLKECERTYLGVSAIVRLALVRYLDSNKENS